MKDIVVFDFETTGGNPETDQVIQYAFKKIDASGNISSLQSLVKPSIPISGGATEVTGITNEMVADQRPFADHATEIAKFVGGPKRTILAGHNIRRFDMPMFANELKRIGRNGDVIYSYETIDTKLVYTHYRPRTLTAMYEDLTGNQMPEDAHDAMVDVDATLDCIRELGKFYGPTEVNGETDSEGATNILVKLGTPENIVDFAGRFALNDDGEVVYTFGKHKGERVLDHRNFAVDFMLQKDFPEETKSHIRRLFKLSIEKK